MYTVWFKGDRKARDEIRLSLSNDNLKQVHGSESAKEIQHAILNFFERHTLLTEFAAHKNFYTVFTPPNKPVLSYLNLVEQAGTILKSMSVTIDDKELAMRVLNGF